MMFFKRRREVAAARFRIEEVVQGIGARDGAMVREEPTGGVGWNGPPGLYIVTLRRGPASAVLYAQMDAAVAYGYQRPPRSPSGFQTDSGRPRTLSCMFPITEGMPLLSVEVVPEGRTFRGIDLQVPKDHSGVVVSMQLHVERNIRVTPD